MISSMRRPMQQEERAVLARERSGPMGRWFKRWVRGAHLANAIEAALARDFEEGMTEVLTIDADASGFLEAQDDSIHVFQSKPDGKIAVLRRSAVLRCAETNRGELIASRDGAGPVIVARAPHSGLLLALTAGRRIASVYVSATRDPPLVLGCELVTGTFSELDAALEQCTFATLTPDRVTRHSRGPMTYAGTTEPVRPGDQVEVRIGGENKPARVIYVPGVSPQHWEARGDAVSVECSDGSRYAVGDVGNLRLLARGPESSIQPDEVV